MTTTVPLTSSIYLSTTSDVLPPVSNSNLANVSWTIDWDTIFHGHTGLCKVYIDLLSNKAQLTSGDIPANWNNLIGTIRGSFSSAFSNNTAGVVLTNMTPNAVVGSSVQYFYTAITEPNQAPTVNVPTGKTQFTLQIMNTAETGLISIVPNYGINLTFEWI